MSRKREEEAKSFLAVMMTAAFCMFAGAAGYHQYLKAQEAKEPLASVSQDQIIPIEEATVYNITTENAYFMAEPVPVSAEAGASDLDLIAACVEAEAGNQDLTGKRLVADVILNRVEAEGFPDTVEGVISQPRHFASYWNGAMDKAEPTEETYKAVRMEMDERSYPGLLYFDSGDYLPYGTPWKKVGDHYFSTR